MSDKNATEQELMEKKLENGLKAQSGSGMDPPSNHMELEGELCKLFYRRFGEGALPIIAEVFRSWGLVLGRRTKDKLSNVSFKVALEAYFQPVTAREPKPEIIEFTEKKAKVKVFNCPYRLNGAGIALCEAMTSMDRAFLEVLLDGNIELELRESLASGDPYCLAILSRK